MRSTACFLLLAYALLTACSDSEPSDTSSISPGAGGSGQSGAGSGGSGKGGGGQAGAGQAGSAQAGSAQAGGGQGGGGQGGAGQGGSSQGGAGVGGTVEPGCCGSDAECQAKGFDRCIEGVCRKPLDEGQCWFDKDCKQGLTCKNPAPCPCNVDCSDDSPGVCHLPEGVCCASASDCEGQGLVNPHCVEGQCKALLETGQLGTPCWQKSDCASDESCVGVQICPCKAEACDAVPDSPGLCQKEGGQGGSAGSGQAGQGGGGSSGAGAGGSGGATQCGGKLGGKCDEGYFCDYPGGDCGATDLPGQCAPKPGACIESCGECPPGCPGVCGCDGQVYCSACGANAHGVAVSSDTSCLETDCKALRDAIAKKTQIVGSCTAVVRLAYLSKKLLGYAIDCGPYKQVTEQSAREAAKAATGFGADEPLLSGPSPQDEYVFYKMAIDEGWATAVSARTGRAVFGGSIIGLGKGDIALPKGWSPASELGWGCGADGSLPPARGFELEHGKPLPDAKVQEVLSVVAQTALPGGMNQSGYVFDAVVLLYPRTVSFLDPQTAEWVVLLNGGWLE